MTTADILKANEWEFYPSIDRGGVAQPEYWTHPDHNGPFTEEEAFRQHESDKLHSGLDGLINQWAETNNALQREVATLRAELADRWRDITANEQQTQRLLNDIENLRAEIAELKGQP